VIGLDSNVLVRYLTQDDPVQSKKADQLVDKALQSGEALYLNHVVLCEVNWVLAKAYGYGVAELGDTLEKILSAAQFEFEDKNCLWQALAAFRASGADFADCVIGVKNTSAGCTATLTFDKRAGTLPQFSLS
jgi:predicted nucleic-acid-binding protein